jgi:cytochrome b subunit of formate dehydrogenase
MVFVGKYQTRGDSGLFLKLVHFKWALIEILEYVDIVGHSDRTAFGLRWPKAIRGPLNGIAKAFGLGEPPVNGKYTATETSLSFFGWSILTTLLVTTGLIKASKYLFATPAEWLRYATTVHDAVIPIVLILLAAHALATILIPANVPMFTSMFTGKVKESWVKEQMPAWYEKLQKESAGGKAKAGKATA